MLESRTYKNRHLTFTHIHDEWFEGRVVCAAHVVIQPGVIAPEFDMICGIGENESASKADAFRRAVALIDFKDTDEILNLMPTQPAAGTLDAVLPLELRIRFRN